MKNGRLKRIDLISGFTVMEMLIVIVIAAILALLAIPSLINWMPYQRMRNEAGIAEKFMQQARLKSASTQKPTRAIVDCTGNCFFVLQSAKYDKGKVAGWQSIPGSRYVPHQSVRVAPIGSTGDGSVNKTGISWIIFMPSGRAFSHPRPFEVFFYNTKLLRRDDNKRPGWRLLVNNDSGRTVLKEDKLDAGD